MMPSKPQSALHALLVFEFLVIVCALVRTLKLLSQSLYKRFRLLIKVLVGAVLRQKSPALGDPLKYGFADD